MQKDNNIECSNETCLFHHPHMCSIKQDGTALSTLLSFNLIYFNVCTYLLLMYVCTFNVLIIYKLRLIQMTGKAVMIRIEHIHDGFLLLPSSPESHSTIISIAYVDDETNMFHCCIQCCYLFAQ